jgi:hypothetical protein
MVIFYGIIENLFWQGLSETLLVGFVGDLAGRVCVIDIV